MIQKNENGPVARKRSRGDSFADNDIESDNSNKDGDEDINVQAREDDPVNELDQTANSVSVSFVSDVNKFLPAVRALYIDETTYFYFSLIAHIIVVFGALFIKDIRTIFDFVGCFGGTFILFWFPSVIFLMMLNKYGRTRHHNSTEYTVYKLLAYLLFICGVISFSLEMYVNIQNLKGESDVESEH